MKIKLITKAELEKRDDLAASDKELVEKQATEYGGGYEEPPDIPLRQAIRGYLVQELDENVIDDDLRAELAYDAASFSEGWGAAMDYQKTASV